jgi:hypothetical protein
MSCAKIRERIELEWAKVRGRSWHPGRAVTTGSLQLLTAAVKLLFFEARGGRVLGLRTEVSTSQ